MSCQLLAFNSYSDESHDPEGKKARRSQLIAAPVDNCHSLLRRTFLILGLMKYTQTTLDKLANILGESGYVVRYERGTFQSGWCLLEERKIVVLNKFLSVEGRINTLLELIPQIAIEFDKLTHESQKLYEDVVKKSATETQ
jgi:hypothetical protein